MSSERRHELQQNELANSLGQFLKPLEKYGLAIGIVVAAIAAVAIGTTLYSSNKTVARSDATLQLLEASGSNDAAQFEGVAESFPNTPAANFARLYQADRLMALGMEALYSDRADAEDQFEAAEVAYQQAITGAGSGTGTDRVLKSRANFGLARIAEAKGDVDAAVKLYEAVVAAAESKPMIELATNRIASLEKSGTQDFLAWFNEQDFSPADPSSPPALADASVLSDEPDMTVPELGSDVDAGDGDTSEDESGDDGSTTESTETEPEATTEETEDTDSSNEQP